MKTLNCSFYHRLLAGEVWMSDSAFLNPPTEMRQDMRLPRPHEATQTSPQLPQTYSASCRWTPDAENPEVLRQLSGQCRICHNQKVEPSWGMSIWWRYSLYHHTHTHQHACMGDRVWLRKAASECVPPGEAALCQSADVQSRREKPPELPTLTGEAFAQASAGCVMRLCAKAKG